MMPKLEKKKKKNIYIYIYILVYSRAMPDLMTIDI